jgi:excisionase family DNA binding protein
MAQHADLPQLLTYQQAANRAAVSKRHVQRLVATGQIPYVKLGSAVRIPAAALAAYIAANTRVGRCPNLSL